MLGFFNRMLRIDATKNERQQPCELKAKDSLQVNQAEHALKILYDEKAKRGRFHFHYIQGIE